MQHCQNDGCRNWKWSTSKEGMCQWCNTPWDAPGSNADDVPVLGADERERLVTVLSSALGTDVRTLLAQHLEAASTAEKEKAAAPPTQKEAWNQLRAARAANGSAENKRWAAEKTRDKLQAQLDAANTKLNEATADQEKTSAELLTAKGNFLRITPEHERLALLRDAGFDELLAERPEAMDIEGDGAVAGTAVRGQDEEVQVDEDDEDDVQDQRNFVRPREEIAVLGRQTAERRRAKKARIAREQAPAQAASVGAGTTDPLGR